MQVQHLSRTQNYSKFMYSALEIRTTSTDCNNKKPHSMQFPLLFRETTCLFTNSQNQDVKRHHPLWIQLCTSSSCDCAATIWQIRKQCLLLFCSQTAHLVNLWDSPYLKLRTATFPKTEMWVRKWSGVGTAHTAARALGGGNPDWKD